MISNKNIIDTNIINYNFNSILSSIKNILFNYTYNLFDNYYFLQHFIIFIQISSTERGEK